MPLLIVPSFAQGWPPPSPTHPTGLSVRSPCRWCVCSRRREPRFAVARLLLLVPLPLSACGLLLACGTRRRAASSARAPALLANARFSSTASVRLRLAAAFSSPKLNRFALRPGLRSGARSLAVQPAAVTAETIFDFTLASHAAPTPLHRAAAARVARLVRSLFSRLYPACVAGTHSILLFCRLRVLDIVLL